MKGNEIGLLFAAAPSALHLQFFSFLSSLNQISNVYMYICISFWAKKKSVRPSVQCYKESGSLM